MSEQDKVILFGKPFQEWFTNSIMQEKSDIDNKRWGDHLIKFCDKLLEDKRELEAKILSFKSVLEKEAWFCSECLQPIMETYYEHFNIATERYGKSE